MTIRTGRKMAVQQGELAKRGILVNYSVGYLVRQAMPYPLATSNSYLIEGDNGWVVIDVGVDLPSTRELWPLVLKAVGIAWSQIEKIYITHCHPDHLGAAAWLQQMTNAPVFMLDREIERAKRYIFLPEDYTESYLKITQSDMLAHGFDQGKCHRLAIDWQAEVRPLYPEPEIMLPLLDNEVIKLMGIPYKVVALAGHTDGQIGFWSKQTGRLFSADLLAVQGGYLHFTDWPNTRSSNPLGDLLIALELVKDMEVAEMLPGHGLMIEQPNQAIEQLWQRHQSQLQRTLSLLQTPHSAAEMYRKQIKLPDEEYIHYHRVSLGEALGYMRYLEFAGEVHSFNQDGVLRFARV